MTPPLTLARPLRVSSTAALLVVGLWLVGCSSTPQPPEPPPLATTARPLDATPAGTGAAASQEPETPRPTYRGPWEDPSNPLYRRTIYFDYDSAAIQPQYLDV
ncbi:MAG TPA: hypothetical protein VES73_06580, partial [Lamprocystis sp. (in: g-proteobacteria)]|nr:hypothetical protein [Lamprocystis sp. (in: g-proteobacteria)]